VPGCDSSKPAERLLVLWVLIGLLELVVHDAGNPRRYVMFIPALVALASIALASGRAWISSSETVKAPWRSRLLFAPLALGLGYLVIGTALQPLLVGDRSAPQPYHVAVSVSSALAVIGTLCLLIWWQPIVSWLSRRSVRPRAAAVLIAAVVLWNLGQYVGWAAAHTDLNYRASVALGRLLPPGTLVPGHARERDGPRESDQADFHRPRLRQLYRSVRSRRRALYTDVRFAKPRVRESARQWHDSRAPQSVSAAPDHRTFDVDETPGAGPGPVLIEKHPK
jgi:hypothetical protein